MRESFGGAFMIKLVLVFIVIYVSFMAVAINYAKAFRIKNRIIDYVEQYQYRSGDTNVLDLIDAHLGEMAYNIHDDGNLANACQNSGVGAIYLQHGACIVPACDNDGEYIDKCYYKVTTYISVNFPLFKINMTLPITGETKTMY